MADSTDYDADRLTISPLDEIDALELRDFLVTAQEDFWGERDLMSSHDPYWFRQLDSSGLVARYQNQIVGYLLGVVPQEGPGYIHLAAAHNDFRHLGIGRALYAAFVDRARQLGKQEVQATTEPENTGAIAFHTDLGFESELIIDYAGPERPRVLFTRSLTVES
ncbi:GNAT family N-acetyltransferase [Brevibacterium sp. BRM-1]|uniref:GNAT family N-acetyltransferase n=1 Tax=Brevibacterium sp. BRM-1 TaxID=2999062 RepID=UPI00228050B5|nr:GNAT family N-acetyltransferase [Brevibacterium sp. BRM-1]WAL41476.1 GNAT family N-acetyltransferase [Brevibacterium sp. BRM-1]